MAGILKTSRLASDNPASELPVTVIATTFVDTTSEVQTVLDNARASAQEIIAQSRSEAARVRVEAEREGRRIADETIRQTADEQLAPVLSALRQTVERLAEERAHHLERCERYVVSLATAIAGRVCRRELERDPEISLALIREALDLAAGNDRIKLHLNPSDYAFLGDRIGELTGRLSEAVTTEIVEDSTISPGGCTVKTEFGTIDQQFEAQLARIEEELTG